MKLYHVDSRVTAMAPLSHPQGEWKSSQRYVSPPCENLTSTALPSENTETPCWSTPVLLPNRKEEGKQKSNTRATRQPPALWLVFGCICRFTSIVRKATTNLRDHKPIDQWKIYVNPSIPRGACLTDQGWGSGEKIEKRIQNRFKSVLYDCKGKPGVQSGDFFPRRFSNQRIF